MQSPSSTVNPTWTLVTPSYFADLARCELLVESVQANNPDAKHCLIIDRADFRWFKHLQSNNVTIVTSEDLLDRWVYRLPLKKSIWLHGFSRPTRGWIMQQIFKIAIANQLSDDVFIFCDSDMFFLRPFGLETVTTDGKIDLLDLSLNIGMGQRWTDVSADLLGLDRTQPEVRGHVGNMIAWRSANVRKLQSHIESTTQRGWSEAIARNTTFSEYTLYGNYIRYVLGYEQSGHVPSEKPIVAHSWGKRTDQPEVIEQLFRDLRDTEVGLMIHSKTPADLKEIRRLAQKFWTMNSVSYP